MLKKHARFLYQPVLPMGANGKMITSSAPHWKVAMEAATEGTVLLKNNGTLPLKKGAKICLFGIGAGDFLLGGGGSGYVYSERKINLADGLKAAAKAGEIEFFSELVDFYRDEFHKIYHKAHQEHPDPADYSYWRRGALMPLPVVPDDLYQKAVQFGDTAIFCVTRYSAEDERNGDREGGKGDFYLWEEEEQLLAQLCEDFEKVVVVLNTCGPVSTVEYKNNPKVGAVLYPLYGGGIAGESLTRILLGKSYPSGHLQHTLAKRIEDYPSTATYRQDEFYTEYKEDIFVGYRYFETMAQEKVVYPFGFGLSYTTFDVTVKSSVLEKNTVKLKVEVKNTGDHPGKEVVQVYLSAPQGKLGKASKVLTTFAKTRELAPGEAAELSLSFDIRQFGSFDDLGKIIKSAFLLEKGEYTVHVGTNVRDTNACMTFTLEDDVLCRQCHSYMAPRALPERLTADGTMEKLPQAEPVKHKPVGYRLKTQGEVQNYTLPKAYEEGRLDDLIASMTEEELTEILCGHPMTNPSDTCGFGLMPRYAGGTNKMIPLVPTADGPMGLRMASDRTGSPTFFPCENVISQTWNLSIAKRLGAVVAKEAKENNIGIWLAPALNIHRNPMCGRNFEYYSEDPVTSGLFACSVVSGVQSQNIAATVKHYCCNNREWNRQRADSRVSERALREVYLRGFEIVVKKAKPWVVMTSYNPVNGEQMSSNWEAINGILRGEWKYDGVVTTDWWVFSNLDEEIHAGGDIKMPILVTSAYKNAKLDINPAQMIRDGSLNRAAVHNSVRRILQMMEKLD